MRIPIKGLFASTLDETFQGIVRISLEQDSAQDPAVVRKETWMALTEGGLYSELRAGQGHRLLDEVRQKAGVASFGKTSDNAHLWREYADEGRGVCIGFETRSLGFKAHPVEYVEEGQEPELRYFGATREQIRAAASLVKYALWRAEDEVRVIIPTKARNFLFFPKEAIVKVVLGSKCPEAFKMQVKRILEERYRDVPCVDQ